MSVSHDAIYGALLQEYNVARIRKVNQERSARIAALKTRADAENYVADVRAKIAGSFAMPARCGVPAATITGVIETPECRIEKIIFDSRPDFPVTAHLYIPAAAAQGKVPAVLFLCGHSQDGKNCSAYQTGAMTLAKNGFAVLVVDPVSQGERLQFLNTRNAWALNGSCTREHNMLGKQMWLCGEFFGSWRAHDALCGLDYLLSRPEVDVSRVGVTGNSGGGTMTTFVQALDARFTMAAPSCYVTSWQRNIENELPADVEQIPPGILAAGCEMGDFVLAYAPRPVLLMGQKNDFFDPRGLQETFEECRKVYALLGAEENLQLFIGPTDHGYSVENRSAMYKFFNTHAAIGMDEKKVLEESVSTLSPSALYCTPTGQAADLPGKKLVHDLLVEKLDDLAAARKKLDLPDLKKVLTEKLNCPESAPVPYCRILRASSENIDSPASFLFSRFGLETTPGLLIPMLFKGEHISYMHFPQIDELTLYVPHLSAGDELAQMQLEIPVAGLDVRGIGETRSRNCDFHAMDNFFYAYGTDYHFNSCDIMFGTDALNGRIHDLLSAIAFVRSHGVKKIRLAGRGQGAIAALFTAIVCQDTAALKLYDAPRSFDRMVREKVTIWPQAVMPRGILKYTDLPDMYEALEKAGKLEIVNFADNFFKPEL